VAFWCFLALLLVAAFGVVPLLLATGEHRTFGLPTAVSRSVSGAVRALLPAASTSPRQHHASKGPARQATAPELVASPSALPARSSHRKSALTNLLPVIVQHCASCRVVHDANTKKVRVSVDGSTAKRGAAFTLLDLTGAHGLVRVHDEIGLGLGEVPRSDVTVLQVTDRNHRIVYQLQIEGANRTLRFISPPGSLNADGIDLSTGRMVPNDGRSELAVDVVSESNRSLTVRVGGQTTISKNHLRGGQTLQQTYVEAGILNATAATGPLTVTHDELQAVVTPTGGGPQTVVATQGASLAPVSSVAPPTDVVLPNVAGSTFEGATLIADPGTWIDANTLETDWSRCNPDGSNCQAIPQAPGSAYTVTSNDVGDVVQARVTGQNDGGSSVAVSALTAVVASDTPIETTPPSITGTPLQGTTLAAQPGVWKWTNAAPTYTWQRCDGPATNCVTIPGANAPAYGLTADDVNKTIQLTVTIGGVRQSAPLYRRT
jgi:hypothetical protein